EDVLDVEETAQRRLDLETAGPERAAARTDLEILGTDFGVGSEPVGHERCPMRILEIHRELPPPLVAHVHSRGWWLGPREQAPLGPEVLVHRAMKIEVVLAQVREDEHVETNSIETSQCRAVRARLDSRTEIASVQHLAEEALQIDRLRSRERRRASLASDLPFDRPDEAR